MVIAATQARQTFFKLLRMVERGKEVVIVSKHSNTRFILTLHKEKPEPKSKADASTSLPIASTLRKL